MSLCVNTHSREFKDLAQRLDMSEASLENILHEYMNTEGNAEAFPSDSYILSKINGQPFEELTENEQKLIELRYSKPIIVDSYNDAQAVMSEMAQYFDPIHIGLKETHSGKYEVKLGDYVSAKEIREIKARAQADGTFMKAPNGKDTNLTEKQWLQVRTSAFKEWFGNWENDPENASKVVDENGEPLVVYHGSKAKFNTFSYEFVRGADSGFFFTSDKGYAKQFGSEEYPVFLNMRNFLPASEIPLHRDNIYSIFAQSEEDVAYLNKVDGIIGNDSIDGKLTPSKGTEFMVYRPNQIKSAVNNIGTFSKTNNNIYYQTKKSESEIIEDANTKRAQKIMELESAVKDLQTQLTSLKTNKSEFINSEMNKINNAVDAARKDIQSKGKVSIDRLNTVIDEFNNRYKDLIQAGIINKLDASSIAPRVGTFNEEGRTLYNTSRILIKRGLTPIKKEVSRRYKNEFDRISNSLKEAQEELQRAERSSLTDFINDSYYQINKSPEEISTVVDKIKPINRKLGALGSISKIEDLLKKADIPTEVRNAIVEGYKAMPSTLKGMTPYEALQYIASAQYKGLVAQYNESIRRPANERLERILTDYLKKYNFEINIGDAVKRFGDVTGVLDIINKIIYVANNRNETTLPEEFGHAFVELLGSTTSKREENKEFTFLMNTVENTELYKTVFENYKDVYKREDGTPDTYKIKKEAIGQGIGLALLSQYQGGHEETRTFLQKLKDFVERILDKFRGTEYLSFENMVNQMAKEVLDGSTKRLDKVDKTGYTLLDYYKTIEEQNKKDGGKALEFMQYFTSIGNDITGSLAYRLQGAVYRGKLDSLHDIDMQVPQSAHGISFSEPFVARAIELARQRNQEELFEVITNSPYFQNIKERYPKVRFGAVYADSKGKNRITVNAVYSEDVSLSERFLKMTGSYAERLDNFTEAERSQIYLFDFFLNGEGEEYTSFFEPTYGINLVDFDKPLREKRWMGRAKDIMDYQNWRVFDDYKNKVLPTEEDLMYQISSSKEATQQEAKENTQTINVWAGRGAENADLSNMAERPFTYEGVKYNSVEHAFQSAKLRYASAITQQPLDVQSAFNNPNLSAYDARTFGKRIIGLDKERWNTDKYSIMKELIKESFIQNPQAFQRLLNTGDAIITHNQDLSEWKTEFPRLLMEVREELREEYTAVDQDGLSVPKDLVRDELVTFQRNAEKTNSELNTILNNHLMSNSEVRSIGAKVIYFISDTITELLEDPNKVFSLFTKLAIRDKKPITEEQKSEEIDKIKKMSRAELAKYVGMDSLIDFAVRRLFTFDGNERFNELKNQGKVTINSIRKAQLITKNINAILKFAKNAFLTVEDFSIGETDNTLTVATDASLDTEDYNGNNDVDSLRETENLQEHWQIIHRTQDVIKSMTQLVKNALNRCFQLTVNPETGATEMVEDEFGIAERVEVRNATSSILKWTIGAESLSHMVELLEAKVATNPWIKQVVDKLRDDTGAEADFQSQFYGVFAKAFQPYSIVLKEKNTKTGKYEYKSIKVNQHPALTDAVKAIDVAYKTNNHPLFDNGKVKADALDTLIAISNDLTELRKQPLAENDVAKLADLISKASSVLGYYVTYDDAYTALDSNEAFYTIVDNLANIVRNLQEGAKNPNYAPFKFGADNNIGNFLQKFLTPLTAKLEETAVTSFYDSGKMYQSYVTPSYLTVLMNKFRGTQERFEQFLEEEYGKYEWFRAANGDWRNVWLETLSKLNEERRKDLFAHKVQLNFNKHNYMKDLSDVEYGLSILTEYFSEIGNAKGNITKAWFRVPIMSNKPSSEYIKMEAYTGKYMEIKLIDGFSKIFQQELSRIQTVEIRDYNKKDPNFIKSFDKNGKKFMMLDFFNSYLKGGKDASSRLGVLINKAITEGTEFDAETKKGLTLEENSELMSLVANEIKTNLDKRAKTIISEWKSNGVFEGAKQIANIGTENSDVETKLREFIWNDTFAAMNILELTITDPAFYKDAEDLQKRLAQIHAPGIRANVEATDYGDPEKGIAPRRVSADGIFRTILLTDFDDFISNIKDNLRIVFDRKLQELEKSGFDKESSKYKAAAATYENIINQFDEINVADAQGYSSPTSYRKKAFLFGKWSRQSEEIYNKLKSNNYTHSDLKTAFQPLKPFVYGQIEKPSIDNARSDIARPLSRLKVPVQFKNSEYLLILADAILQGEETGKPNLLRAIYEVMEESAEKNPGRGIDTIQFESTCKSGLMAPINIKQFYNSKGGETMAKLTLEQAIYNTDGSYNTGTYVYEVPFENYAIQQEVPEHFKDHYQAHGSQIRYIIPTDLETEDSEGNPVTYNYFDRGVEKKLSAEEFKEEYEQNISENIESSLQELSEQLGLDEYYLSQKDRNIALSKILLEEIYRSPRYGVELASACTVDSETGKFNIPLGDPIQSKRIEQLINSVVKNRINKQEIAGGPVVQVTNFGTSRELNIRFNSKGGGLLMTRAEFENSGMEGTFEDYIKENQAGIAYYEVFAPIFSNELFEKFADKYGNIDIETIEMINPDLLKMIGYRIPTEDKYSAAPLKIVGFLPREAGDGIMLPNDITLLTGSDFDVDKFYLMRKEIGIAMRQTQQESVTVDNFDTAAKEFTKGHKQQIRNHLKKVASNLLFNETKLTEEEENKVKERISNKADFSIEQENKRHQAALEQIEEDATDALIAYDEQNEAGNTIEGQEEKAETKVERAKQKQIDKENRYHEKQVAKYEARRETETDVALDREQERKLNNVVNEFLEGDIFAKSSDKVTRTLKEAYVKYMFDYIEATEGTTYRNNKVVDMSWAVLTNETTASKILTPGGFESEKSMGYLVSAMQNPANNFTWEELVSLENRTKGLLNGKIVDLDPNNDDIETGIDALKSLCYTEKNLAFIDTHLQFYKQNSAASTALGMAAVQKIAHAVLESNGFRLSINEVLNLKDDEFMSIADKEFRGMLEVDSKYNDEGDLIGRTLGEFVAMFADAVKDPVANLMNINNTTMPVVTAMIRLGMPFRDAALFISQPTIRRVLELYNSENVTNFASLSDVINKQIKKINERYGVEEDSYLNELNTLTREEMISALNPRWRERHSEEADVIDFKVLKFFQNLDKIAKALKGATYATRFNSISNAVGPLVIDNLIKEYKVRSEKFTGFYDREGNKAGFSDILEAHPILNSFFKTLAMSKVILEEMPANSINFREIVFTIADEDLQNILFNDKKTLSELSDFYQSYLLIASGTVPTQATKENKHQGLKYYIEQFPSDFMKGNAKELFRGNALIDAIKLDIQKGRTVLKVDTTGLQPQDREKLSDGWADLYKSGERGRKLAEHLFYYNFWRTGIGFSPKSFMNLFPSSLKSSISGYNESFDVHTRDFAANVRGDVVLDQFVANNADNNRLAPRVKLGKEGLNPEIKKDRYVFSGNDYYEVANKPYIKVKQGSKDILLKRSIADSSTKVVEFAAMETLGNNGEYFEASVEENYKALAVTDVIEETPKEGEITGLPTGADTEDAPTTPTESSEQERKRLVIIKNLILKAFENTGRTREQAIEKIKEFKAKPEAEKNALESQMKKFLRNKFTKLGVEVNDKLVDEAYKELC